MGLDLFAHGVDPQKFQDLPSILCGSMFTDGQSSIRGKTYAKLIDEICDVNLYQQKLPNKELQHIVTQLSVYCVGAMDITNDEDKYTLHKSLGFSLEEIKALLDWFKTVKENNGQVIGWW